MLKENGFTLLEFLVVLIIMSMVIAMSIPAFSSYIRGTRLRTAAREISTAIMSARTQAITLRKNRTVFFDTAEGNFGIEDDEEGWLLPPGVRFHFVGTDFPSYGITLTPMGTVYDIPADGYFDITIFGIWGAEPFTDANNNGVWDTGEPFTDTNSNGVWDIGEAQRTIGVGELGHVVIN